MKITIEFDGNKKRVYYPDRSIEEAFKNGATIIIEVKSSNESGEPFVAKRKEEANDKG